MSEKRGLSPISVLSILFISETLFLAVNILNFEITGPVIPLNYWLFKDILDVLIVIVFPWNGWVFGMSLVLLMMCEINTKQIAVMFVLSTIITAIVSTIYGFDSISLGKIFVGLFTYSIINILVLVFVFAFYSTIKGVVKWLR